jgi:hypothetical protein
MKAKTIRRVLDAKVKDWVESITDPVVAKIIQENTIVTGGSIASMLLCEPINDFDVYFQTEDAAKAVAEYYIKQYIETTKPAIEPELKLLNGRYQIVVKSAGMASEGTDDSTYKYFEMLPEDNIQSTEYVDPV